jgi:hypothetical protein
VFVALSPVQHCHPTVNFELSESDTAQHATRLYIVPPDSILQSAARAFNNMLGTQQLAGPARHNTLPCLQALLLCSCRTVALLEVAVAGCTPKQDDKTTPAAGLYPSHTVNTIHSYI